MLPLLQAVRLGKEVARSWMVSREGICQQCAHEQDWRQVVHLHISGYFETVACSIERTETVMLLC
jgi:hypothetical protein